MIVETPRVTVLMAVHNGGWCVAEAIGSILAQNFTDFEFLIVDDGSTDDTQPVLASFKDTRIRVLSQERQGLTRSLARGLAFARGLYVARQDADDSSRPDRLGKQVAYLEAHPEAVLVGSGATMVNEHGGMLRDYLYPTEHEEIVRELDRLVSPLPHTTIMFRLQEVLRCGGYREVFAKAQDYDLYLRLAERYHLSCLPEPLCRLRYSMTSLTSEDGIGLQFQYAVLALITALVRRQRGVDPLDLPDRDSFLRSFRDWYRSSPYPDIFRSRQLRRRARLEWEEGRVLEAVRCGLQAVYVDPAWAIFSVGLRRPGCQITSASAWARQAGPLVS